MQPFLYSAYTAKYLAAWDDAMDMNCEIKRGQCCTTVKELSAINQRTLQQTRTVLNRLVSTNDITIEAPPQFCILTLTNYDELQPANRLRIVSLTARPLPLESSTILGHTVVLPLQ